MLYSMAGYFSNKKYHFITFFRKEVLQVFRANRGVLGNLAFGEFQKSLTRGLSERRKVSSLVRDAY